MSTTTSLDEVLSEALMEVYDNGTNPNALREARAVIARVGESAWAEAVRAEERERCDPAKDERLARYMALVTPLGYASALEVVNSLTAMMNAESRANEIADQARAEALREFAGVVREIAALGPQNSGLRTPDHLAEYAANYADRIEKEAGL